jgi:hypothetical protein
VSVEGAQGGDTAAEFGVAEAELEDGSAAVRARDRRYVVNEACRKWRLQCELPEGGDLTDEGGKTRQPAASRIAVVALLILDERSMQAQVWLPHVVCQFGLRTGQLSRCRKCLSLR